MHMKSLKYLVFALLLPLSACGMFGSKEDESAKWSAEKLYSEARDDMEAARYESAIKNFERLESRYPFGVYAQQAQMEVAYAYYRQGNKEEAVAAADRFIKLHPNHAKVDYMYYLRGLINFNDRLGMLDFVSHQDPSERDPKAARDSFEAFKLLVERFPGSSYTPDALGRMKYLIGALAKYEVHVARYYFRRGAYVAALNRAQAAVRDYQENPAVEEGLFIMMKSYDALNLHDLRDDTERVLRLNYPNSAYLNGSRRIEKSWWRIW
ncbi:MAG: outer membrane protein assembly factor BamD [Paucimonas sp.]|jgi:outer membrane protein assembly factor BamD|nr:outer membrane protein assembly factor BamD [Paucimonas sp.]